MLFRKMLRDIHGNLVSWAACILIIAVGLLTYVSMANTRDILLDAKDSYYRDFRFGDVFAGVEGYPVGKLDALARIPGIRTVDAKMVRDVRVLIPGRTDNVYLRLVSVDLSRENRLNDLWLVEGSMVRPGTRSVLLGVEFFNKNGFQPGDKLDIVINGARETLDISGKGQSPEYVYAMKNATDFLPASENFGVAYLSFDAMESLFQTNGAVDSISFTLDTGITYEDVKEKIRVILKPYKLQLLQAGKDQISNFMLTSELTQLGSFATSAPFLFLSVSTVILWIMLKRMVEHQRMQIGMLKAAGYTAWEVLRHYLSFALFVGILGGVLGTVLGFVLAGVMTDMYKEYFTLPGLENRFSPTYFLYGMSLSIGFSVLAGWLGARSVLRLSPAVAMAAPAPPSGHRISLEEFKLFWRSLTVQGRMAMRNVFRSKARSLFTVFGIAMSFALMASIFSFTDLFDVFVMDTFRYTMKYDMKVSLSAPASRAAVLSEVGAMPGVRMVEPLLEIPATLRNGHREKSTILIANIGNPSLYQVVDKNNESVRVPDEGIILCKPLADRLEAEIGDLLDFESPYQKKKDLQIPVVGIVPQYIGQNAYMNQDALIRLLGQGELATSVLIRVDAPDKPALKGALLKGATIAGVDDIQQTQQGYATLMDQFFFMVWIMVGMVILVGFAIIYNSSVISLSERERELASLRVLGMDLHEVQEVISFEQNFLAFFGILLGIPLTYAMYKGMADGMQTDIYVIPIIINVRMFLYALLGTVGSLCLAYLNIRRRLRRLDMVEVLKARE